MPITMSVGLVTIWQCIMAPLHTPISTVGTASDSSAFKATAILRPVRIFGLQNKAMIPSRAMTTPMPSSACAV